MQFGHKLAHYEILELIGKGGMGEVYRAKDSTLGRDVAIKVLPDELAGDEERLRRFQREAKVLASLNHPNIAAIYGLEYSHGTHYLVLELVPGETLAERIARGPIPVDEAFEIATKIAEALEEAHEQGIVHRDLKPANIKLTPDGKIKVLDFGLAKAFVEDSPDADSSMSPTITKNATRVGVILGTAAYMSPEQAKGKRVDKRTDIFAFGAVLYEMLTGIKAFPGQDVSEVLASVIKLEPDWSALDVTPRRLALVRRCLDKDPKKRWRDIGDVKFAMVETEPPTTVGAIEVAPRKSSLSLVAVVLAVGGLAAALSWNLKPEVPAPVSRFAVYLPEGENFSYTGRRSIAFSPDGRRIAYVANWHLNLRALDDMEAVPLAGTEGSRAPFFSPDGEWIGFWADGVLHKVSVHGGPPVRLCEAPENLFGASWGSDGTIFFGQGPRGIWHVSSDGGNPEVLVQPEEGERTYGAQLLPDEHHVLYSLVVGSDWNEAEIRVKSLDTGETRILMRGGSDARYVPTGHLMYAIDHTMLAVPFDAKSLEIHGGPIPVIEGVARSLTVTAAAHASFSETGSLAYIPEDQVAQRIVVWIDRSGRVSEPLTEPGNILALRASPDGNRLALVIQSSGVQDVWILEVSRNTLTRLTTGGASFPAWSPDGTWITYQTTRGRKSYLYRLRTDFSGSPEPLLERDGALLQAQTYSRDDKWLVYREYSGGVGKLWALSLDGSGEPRPLTQTQFDELRATLSPDGRYMAYESDESGRAEIYATPFPETGRKWTVSNDGGTRPIWSSDGREIFYRGLGPSLMSVQVETSPDFRPSAPVLLFEKPPLDGPDRLLDASPDGQRFFTLRDVNSESGRIHFNVVLNWHEELKRLVPVE